MRVNADRWTPAGVKALADKRGYLYQLDIEQPPGDITNVADFSGRRLVQKFLADQSIRENRDVLYKSYRARSGERRMFFAFSNLKHATVFRLQFGGSAVVARPHDSTAAGAPLALPKA